MTELKWKLTACRVNRGLTQKEAADLMHVSAVTVIAHESGKTKPSFAQLRMYAEIYGVPVEIIDADCR